MKYISTKQASVKWGISERRIRVLCNENRISGAFSLGNTWNIPEDAEKPEDNRVTKRKQVVVFGASQGVGEAIADKFFNMHCDVFCLDKREHKNQNIKSKLIKYANQQAIINACEDIENVDLLVVYPSIYINSPIISTNLQDLENIININFKTCFYVIQALIEKIRKSKGQVIVMSSSAGVMPEPMSPAYSASHAALMMFAKCLAISEGSNRVRVNTVVMGPATDAQTFTKVINEEQIKNWKKLNPLNDMCEIKDFVDAVVYLSGFAGSKVDKITGAMLAVDCGETITSGLSNWEDR